MSAYPFTNFNYSPIIQYSPFSFQNHLSNDQIILQMLLTAHSNIHQNHAYLLNQLKKLIIYSNKNIESYGNIIGLYLTRNLQNNIQLQQTMQCLNCAHSYFNVFMKKNISEKLIVKYSPFVNFSTEIKKIRLFDEHLAQRFLTFIEKIVRWFKMQIYKKQTYEVQFYQVNYLANYINLITSFEFSHNMKIQSSQIIEYIILFHSILIDNSEVTYEFISTQNLIEQFVESLYHFLNNFQFHLNSQSNQLRVLKISLSELFHIIKLKNQNYYLEERFIKLMFRKVRTFVKVKRSEEVDNRNIEEIMFFIVNVLFIDDWSVQKELFWVWKFRNVCDILQIESEKQKSSISTIKSLLKELSRWKNILN